MEWYASGSTAHNREEVTDKDCLPVVVEQWEAMAKEVLDKKAFGYIAGGSGAEETMQANLCRHSFLM